MKAAEHSLPGCFSWGVDVTQLGSCHLGRLPPLLGMQIHIKKRSFVQMLDSALDRALLLLLVY